MFGEAVRTLRVSRIVERAPFNSDIFLAGIAPAALGLLAPSALRLG